MNKKINETLMIVGQLCQMINCAIIKKKIWKEKLLKENSDLIKTEIATSIN